LYVGGFLLWWGKPFFLYVVALSIWGEVNILVCNKSPLRGLILIIFNHKHFAERSKGEAV
jgi:hypothetical protein